MQDRALKESEGLTDVDRPTNEAEADIQPVEGLPLLLDRSGLSESLVYDLEENMGRDGRESCWDPGGRGWEWRRANWTRGNIRRGRRQGHFLVEDNHGWEKEV